MCMSSVCMGETEENWVTWNGPATSLNNCPAKDQLLGTGEPLMGGCQEKHRKWG